LGGRRQNFTYNFRGKLFKYDTATREATVTGDAPEPPEMGAAAAVSRTCMEQDQSEMPADPVAGCPTGANARGRQAFCVESPDHKLKAFYRNRNLWVANLALVGT